MKTYEVVSEDTDPQFLTPALGTGECGQLNGPGGLLRGKIPRYSFYWSLD